MAYRPVDPERYTGTMVLHWNNVSAGYDLLSGDTPEIFDGSYAFAGVTTQRVGVHGLPVAPQGLQAWDPACYGTLRSRATTTPSTGLDVERVIAMGSSQSAGPLATYVTRSIRSPRPSASSCS